MTKLRDKALAILQVENFDTIDKGSIKALLHEIEVYQAELEIQNNELRLKEEALLKSKEELSLLFLNSPVGFIILDKDFIIKRYNKLAFDILELYENKINLYIFSFFVDLSKTSDFITWINNIDSKPLEIEIKSKNKSVRYVELKHVKVNLEDENIHLVSIEDISERILKEQEIQKFNFIMDQLPVCVLITDVKGKIIYVNKELIRIVGYKREEILGKKPSLFKSNYTSQEVYKKLWSTVLDGRTWTGVFKNITKTGDSHWMSTAITPLYNDKNEIENFISVESNIDDRVQLQKAIQEQEEMMTTQARHAAMGEMIAMIAHQWRQPLSIISTISSGIKVKADLDIFDKTKDLDDIDKITQTSKYLSDTINDFSNFFKTQKVITEIQMSEVTNKIVALNSNLLKSEGIDMLVKNDSYNTFSTYPNELLQIMLNITNNAKDALVIRKQKNKYIEINCYENNDKFYIEINDNAGGIPEDIVKKIFEPYFTTKGPQSGTGLGLHIAQTIMYKHLKGSISVCNKDDGASFTIELPNLKYL